MSEFKQILEPIAELLEKKNTDYGDSYRLLRQKYGPVGFYIRVADKLNRIEQVDKSGALVGESAIDTLKDIIGYVALEIRYRQNEKKSDGKIKSGSCVTCKHKNTKVKDIPCVACEEYSEWEPKQDYDNYREKANKFCVDCLNSETVSINSWKEVSVCGLDTRLEAECKADPYRKHWHSKEG